MSTVCQLCPQRGVRGDGNFLYFCVNSVLIRMIFQLYFIIHSRRNKSKRHASCLFTNNTDDTVPRQRGFHEKLRESCLVFQFPQNSRDILDSQKVKDTPQYNGQSSSSRMRVTNHNWSARKQRLHLQSAAGISRHLASSEDRIRQCGTSSGSHHKDTDQCLQVAISFCRHHSVPVP